MFLTGFDNKLLNTLYVDKNLQYHSLIQAFSRTNRIYNEKKKQGNIICFRNLKKETDEAIALYSDEDASEFVLMKPYENYVSDFNETLTKLYDLVYNPENVSYLPSEKEDKIFVQIFRELLRIMNRLTVFTEFNFKDLKIPEQEFEDFRSKYVDMYQKYVENPVKTSVVDDIDFEIELVRRDNINVMYILSLLKELDYSSPSFVKDKEFILSAMDGSPELKSKVSLVEKFIDTTLIESNEENIEENFNVYLEKEKQNAVVELIEEEDLKPEVIKHIISTYEFNGKIKNKLLKDSFNEELGFIKKRMKTEEVKNMIIQLVDKYSW